MTQVSPPRAGPGTLGSSRRRVLLSFGLLAASSLVALGMGEGVVRLASLAPPVARIELGAAESPFEVSDDPVLAYEPKPDFVDPSRPSFRTNSHRLWGPEWAIPKPPGVVRIALVGDSIVEGYGLEREQDTIGSRLQATLRGDFEVLSAGVRGYNTRAEVEFFERQVLAYQPDAVVLVFVRNDYRNFNADLNAAGYPRPRWVERLLSSSQLVRFAAFRLNWWHFRDEADPEYLERRHREAEPENNVAVGLDRLARLSQLHGFRPMVVVWPNFSEVIRDPPGLFDAGDPGRMTVEVLAARHGIPVVRLGSAFTRDYAGRGRVGKTPRELYTTDGMHPSPEGARVAAVILAQLIYERGLLSAGGASDHR
jgi:lysophospholipase L1-like esterase